MDGWTDGRTDDDDDDDDEDVHKKEDACHSREWNLFLESGQRSVWTARFLELARFALIAIR